MSVALLRISPNPKINFRNGGELRTCRCYCHQFASRFALITVTKVFRGARILGLFLLPAATTTIKGAHRFCRALNFSSPFIFREALHGRRSVVIDQNCYRSGHLCAERIPAVASKEGHRISKPGARGGGGVGVSEPFRISSFASIVSELVPQISR